jgi:hypothetical protein
MTVDRMVELRRPEKGTAYDPDADVLRIVDVSAVRPPSGSGASPNARLDLYYVPRRQCHGR